MAFCYTHRSVPCSVIIRKLPIAADGNKPTAKHYATLSTKWEVYIKSLPPFRAQGALRKRRQKECKSQKKWRTPRKQGHLNMSKAHMNSERLRQHVQGLHQVICIHACIHTYMHTYIHIYMHECMHIYTYTYIYTYIHIYICMLVSYFYGFSECASL